MVQWGAQATWSIVEKCSHNMTQLWQYQESSSCPRSLRYLKLTVFVHPNILKKLFIRPVKWGIFTCLQRLCFLSNHLHLATVWPQSTLSPFLFSMLFAHCRGLQLFEQLWYFLYTNIKQHSALAFNFNRMQQCFDTQGHTMKCLKAVTFSYLVLVSGTISTMVTYSVIKIFPISSKSKYMGIVICDTISDKYSFLQKGIDIIIVKIVQHNDWLEDKTANMAHKAWSLKACAC